jgi:hypothetical protein
MRVLQGKRVERVTQVEESKGWKIVTRQAA